MSFLFVELQREDGACQGSAHERAPCADTERIVSTGSGSSPEGRDDESPALREAAPSDALRRR
jgi:hypothetical protein